MNYEELVRKMRTCIGDKKCFEKECRYWSELGCMDGNICCDAAAAIEELDAEETRLLLLTSDLQDKLMDLQAAQPHWVSVDDPPKENGRYLVSWEGAVKTDEYRNGVWLYASMFNLSVTHWMPLPEPPKEVQE